MLYHFASGNTKIVVLLRKKQQKFSFFFFVASSHKVVKRKKIPSSKGKKKSKLTSYLSDRSFDLTAMQETHILLDPAARRKQGAQFSLHLIRTPFLTSTLKLHCMPFPVIRKKVPTYLETINHTSKFINHKLPSGILQEKWPSMVNFSSLVLYLNNTVMLVGRLRIPAKSLF